MSEMINMAPPWPGMTREEIFCAVDAGTRPSIVSENATSMPSGWSEVMHQCWDQDPAQRPEFSAIVEKLQQIETSVHDNGESLGAAPKPPKAITTHTNNNSESGTEMITHSGNSKLVMELRSVADRHEQEVIKM